MAKESVIVGLAQFVNSISYEKLSDAVTGRAKNLILDALGTAILGRDMPCSRIALELVKGNRGNATVLTHNLTVPTLDAAFANSVFTATKALDDFLLAFHPGQIMVPTAIAVAEQQGSSGADFISAMVAGYEVMGRIYLGAPSIIPRFRGVPVFGPFGAAATAGKLLDLDEDQLTNALAFAANFASGIQECWIAGSMEGFFHGGVAARNGIMAANLAKAGAMASKETLEGKFGFYQAFAGTTRDVKNILLDIGKRFLTMEVTYKPYPVCAYQQIPIDLVRRLVEKHHILAHDIRQVVEKVPELDSTIPGSDNPGPFENGDQTLLSGQFCAAAAFLGKPVTSHSFYMSNYNDSEILSLAGKVKVIGEKDRNVPEITVTLNDGRIFRIEEEKERGTLTPTDEKIRAKFNELSVPFLGKERAREVINMVTSLEKVRNIKGLTRLLVCSGTEAL